MVLLISDNFIEFIYVSVLVGLAHGVSVNVKFEISCALFTKQNVFNALNDNMVSS